MADFAEIAADREAEIRADGLAAHALQMAADRERVSARECQDCGEEIPEARRSAQPGCTRCVPCQEEYDRRFRG